MHPRGASSLCSGTEMGEPRVRSVPVARDLCWSGGGSSARTRVFGDAAAADRPSPRGCNSAGLGGVSGRWWTARSTAPLRRDEGIRDRALFAPRWFFHLGRLANSRVVADRGTGIGARSRPCHLGCPDQLRRATARDPPPL